jgi:hypothetical protein
MSLTFEKDAQTINPITGFFQDDSVPHDPDDEDEDEDDDDLQFLDYNEINAMSDGGTFVPSKKPQLKIGDDQLLVT